jgi:hypothetical protein
MSLIKMPVDQMFLIKMPVDQASVVQMSVFLFPNFPLYQMSLIQMSTGKMLFYEMSCSQIVGS